MEGGENAPIDEGKLTKGQKKALKEKQKREAALKAAAEGKPSEALPATTPAPAPAKPSGPAKAAKGKKGKKVEPSAAAKFILQQKAEKQRELEEQLREEEEIRRKEAEERRKKEEEERKAREAEEAEEKKRIEEIRRLKKAGLWKSKKELEREEELLAMRRQLIEQGLIEMPTDGGEPKKKVVYSSKKKRGKNGGKEEKKDKKKDEEKEEKDEEGSKDVWEVEKEEGKEEVEKEEQEEVIDTSKKGQEVAQPKKETKPVAHVLPGQEEDFNPQAKADAAQAEEDLNVDNWEDLLNDEVMDKQVKNTAEAPVPTEENVDTKAPKPEAVTEGKADSSNAPAKGGKSAKGKDKSKAAKEETKDYSGGFSIFERAKTTTTKSKGKKGKKKTEPVVEEEDDGTKLRCPIIWVLGHVDTGKTLLLDKIRKTNVQRGEAGGITQQIGATYFPGEALQKNLDKLDDFEIKNVKIPGLLVIDTPGHESFTNLRSRGSNLCDLAILVVDIMHGLEKQTLESIDLLRKRKTPFVVALNKIDVMHSWNKEEFRSCRKSLEIQEPTVFDEYEMRRNKAFLQFNENGLNIWEYWTNEDPAHFISAVPTSAMTGEGIPDLLGMVVKYTQVYLKKKVMQRNTEFQCTVLEVKKITGVGTTIDVVLVNGKLEVGDTIVVAGFNGPIVTKIRALLTPQPMKEMRVKGEYIHHDVLYGAMGIKISAPELDYALAGGELFKADSEDQIDDLCDEISEQMLNFAEKYVNPKLPGVCVQASTLGSLEALLEFLKTSKIPVCSVNIGPIFKKDVMKALKSLVGEKVKKEYATLLAFDVDCDPEAKEFAEENGIKIFEANIIYHLFDMFTEYVAQCKAERKGAKSGAVYPCVLEIIDKNHIFHNWDPILIGVNVKGGILMKGTPLCAIEKDKIKIGVVSGIQKQGKEVNSAREIDGGISVKIDNEKNIMAGKHFDEKDQIVSLVTRDTIDALKDQFKEGLATELTNDDWKLMIKIKQAMGIP